MSEHRCERCGMRGDLEPHADASWHDHCWRAHLEERDAETAEHLRALRDSREVRTCGSCAHLATGRDGVCSACASEGPAYPRYQPRPCPECHCAKGHKMDCSRNPYRQVVLTAHEVKP